MNLSGRVNVKTIKAAPTIQPEINANTQKYAGSEGKKKLLN
jgi:hypothetical protein